MSKPALVAEERIAREVEAAKVDYERALAQLTPKQRAFVEGYLQCGHWRDAAEAAGFDRVGQELTRLRRNPRVQAAIEAGAKLRSADAAPITKEEMLHLLTAMFFATQEDFLIRNASGDPIGVREPASMSRGQRAAFRKLQGKVRRSVTGERAHVVDLIVETVDPVRVAELICAIQGWVKRGPAAAAVVQNVFRRPVTDAANRVEVEELDMYMASLERPPSAGQS